MSKTSPNRFAELALPHLDAAYNLARWLLRDDADAQDAVHDAYLRADRGFAGFKGDAMRPWFLAIVRNTAYTVLKARGRYREIERAEDTSHAAAEWAEASAWGNPENERIRFEERRAINAALALLPIDYREVLILREIEEMPYHEIAQVIDAPMGTVMSRLSRARIAMRALLRDVNMEPHRGP